MSKNLEKTGGYSLILKVLEPAECGLELFCGFVKNNKLQKTFLQKNVFMFCSRPARVMRGRVLAFKVNSLKNAASILKFKNIWQKMSFLPHLRRRWRRPASMGCVHSGLTLKLVHYKGVTA